WYFKNQGEARPRGEFILSGQTVITTSDAREFGIEIVMPRHVLVLAAENEEERKRWMEGLLIGVQCAKTLASTASSSTTTSDGNGNGNINNHHTSTTKSGFFRRLSAAAANKMRGSGGFDSGNFGKHTFTASGTTFEV